MSGDVEAQRPRPLSGGLWSLLSWLRRDDPSLSIESLSSIGSDRTTASFAFLTPERYRFGNKPTVLPPPGPPTDSYKRRVHDRNLRYKYDHNITLHRKYGLHKSQESVGYDTFSLPYNKSDNLIKIGRERRATSEGFHRRTVHVPGKRRAPPPPTRASSLGPSTTFPRKSRKRPAPLPPSIELKDTQKVKEDKKVNSKLSMNTTPEHDINLLKSNNNRTEAKQQKLTKTESNGKETRVRPEKNFLRNIFENRKRHSIETASLRILPSISELDKQAAEIIKTDRFKLSQNYESIRVGETTPKIPSDEMWICTKCFRKYKTSVPKCLHCVTEKDSSNVQSEVLKNNSLNASNIYTQTDIETKSSCSKNSKVDEKQKLKEMLKEMKDSLPKKVKHGQDNVSDHKAVTKSDVVKNVEEDEPFISTPTLRIGHNEKDDKTSSKLQTILETNKEVHAKLSPIMQKPFSENIAPKVVNDKPIKNIEQNVVTQFKGSNMQNTEIHKRKSDLNTPLKISLLLNPTSETNSEKSVSDTSSETVKNNFKCIGKHSDAEIKASPKTVIKNANVMLVTEPKPSDSKDNVKPSSPTANIVQIPKYDNNEKILATTHNINPNPSTSAVASTSFSNHKEDTHIQNINHHLKRRELINQLEKSIANGDEQAAAEAAVKLAQLRLSCSVLSFSSQIVGEFNNKELKSKQVTKVPVDNKAETQEQPKTNKFIPPSESKSSDSSHNLLEEKKELKINVPPNTYDIENKKKKIDKTVLCKAATPDRNVKVIINVWVEDREATRGPINLNIGKRDVLADLRQEAERSFGIPANLQRWIIGRTLCCEDNTPLFTLAGAELKAPFYLCLVKSDKSTSTISRILNKQKLDPSTSETDTKPNVYNELMQLEQQSLIENTERFECGVCMEECVPGKGVVLRECVHSFCRDCLSDVIRHSEEPDVSCPATACPGLLQEREIRTLVSPEDYEKWLARGLAAAESGTRNSFHCRTMDCTGWALCEPGVQRFPCPVCKKINCVPCQSIHEGETCEQHRARLEAVSNANTNQTDDSTRALLSSLIKKGEALECPECKAIITKKWGCDWVKCSACKTEICWVTRGRRWGPTGRGDTSAGCRCGVDGKRCHPSCGYCH